MVYTSSNGRAMSKSVQTPATKHQHHQQSQQQQQQLQEISNKKRLQSQFTTPTSAASNANYVMPAQQQLSHNRAANQYYQYRQQLRLDAQAAASAAKQKQQQHQTHQSHSSSAQMHGGEHNSTARQFMSSSNKARYDDGDDHINGIYDVDRIVDTVDNGHNQRSILQHHNSSLTDDIYCDDMSEVTIIKIICNVQLNKIKFNFILGVTADG